MEAATILGLVQAAVSLYGQVSALYASTKATLSETDQATIEAALASIQQSDDADFTRVDGELKSAE